jgi:hypothetical protein
VAYTSTDGERSVKHPSDSLIFATIGEDVFNSEKGRWFESVSKEFYFYQYLTISTWIHLLFYHFNFHLLINALMKERVSRESGLNLRREY